MQITVHPSSISGSIQAPSSKSAMQRALAGTLLCKKLSYIHYHTLSNDDKAALNIIQYLGAIVDYIDDNTICINSKGIYPNQTSIDCGESGLSTRMFIPIAALSNSSIQIIGQGTLLQRPMHFFNDIFQNLQVNIKSNNGYLPITVQGPLKPTNIEIDGSISSQFLTGLLFAYSAANANNTTIKVNRLNSKPYIDLTLQLIKHFGLKCPINKDYKEFYFDNTISHSSLSTIHYEVEGDWSSAAFLLVAGAIAGSVSIKGLNMQSLQADKVIIEVLQKVGANVLINSDHITVSHDTLKEFYFDATDCPDLFPPLVALAAHIEGTSTIKGVKRLINKESNRAVTLQKEFNKLDIYIHLDKDEMHITSTGTIKGAIVHSNYDHRIAMACAVAALKATDPIIIQEAQVVAKSYPGFYEDLKRLNASISIQ